jgi:hypothetical protein
MNYETSRFAEFRRRLVLEHPEIDEGTLQDTLEGATNLAEALSAVIRSALLDERMALSLAERIKEMRSRQSRFEQSADAKRYVVLQAMQEASLYKFVEPDFTVSVRKNPPQPVIITEDEIPDEFWIPQPARLDKKAVGEALRGGRLVPGAMLDNAKSSLTIRVG